MPIDPKRLNLTFGKVVAPLTAKVADFTALVSSANKNRLLEAVRFGHGLWRQQARFQNIVVNAISAMGPPGCLAGPALEPLIRTAPGVAADQGAAASLRDAVARGVSECFAAWQGAVMVPGLPWYPSFVAFPGALAPPMPNVPMPLVSCPSGQAGKLTPQPLKQAITAALPATLKVAQVETAVGALAQSISTYFTVWIASQQVMNVMGQGPVPSFAPPYVPVGPVVGGSVISTPGHLASGMQPQMIAM